jgi:hypothetical protein
MLQSNEFTSITGSPVSVRCFRIFSLLSAILHLGNIRYKRKAYRDEAIDICNPEVLPIVSELLEVSYHLLVIGVMLSFFMLVCVSIHTGASQ